MTTGRRSKEGERKEGEPGLKIIYIMFWKVPEVFQKGLKKAEQTEVGSVCPLDRIYSITLVVGITIIILFV